MRVGNLINILTHLNSNSISSSSSTFFLFLVLIAKQIGPFKDLNLLLSLESQVHHSWLTRGCVSGERTVFNKLISCRKESRAAGVMKESNQKPGLQVILFAGSQ